MQKRIVYPIALLVLCIFGVLSTALFVSPHSLFAQDGPPPDAETANLMAPAAAPVPPFIPGTVLVALRSDLVTDAAISWGDLEVLTAEPLDLRTSRKPYTEASAANVEGVNTDYLVGYKLTVPSGTEWATIEALTTREDVVFAEPDWLAQIAQNNAPDASLETPYVINETLYRDVQWYLQRIGTSRAWALASEELGSNFQPVDVFVIDTGIDPTHPDLASRVTAGRNYVTAGSTPFDDNGHGTHVSGLAAAAINGTGMTGSGLQVRITPYKALGALGTGGVSIIGMAIRDAVDEGADIINLSLELSIDTFALRSAVQYAVNEGVLVIAASGNQNRADNPDASPPVRGVSYPAAYPSVLAVGATTYSDVRAYYSNRGVDLDMVAPGGSSGNSILSTWTRYVDSQGRTTCKDGYREVDGGVYCLADGTSMATGIVSGVAALIMSLRPDLDAEQVQQLLIDSAAPVIGSASDVGAGRLDAQKAVRMALRPRLLYSPADATTSAVVGTAPFVVEMPFANASLEPITVTVSPLVTTTWYSVVGSSTGQVSHGYPLSVQLLFTPTTVNTVTLQSTLRITATTSTGGTSVYFVYPSLDMYPSTVGPEKLYVPSIQARRDGFQWAEPTYSARIYHSISSDSNFVLDLPFTMTVNSRQYNDIRIFADGFVVASGSALPSNLPNQCLDNKVWPSFAVYGWWSDLSVGSGSTLSTFQPDADRLVIEYNGFVSQASFDPEDRVSFQMVLSRNGKVELNYLQVPKNSPSRLTVGASIEDGRFYNQVTCHLAGSLQLGEIPRRYQSFVIDAEAFF